MSKAVKVERRGRKRKSGPRFPSGDLVSHREVLEARVIAFRQPHKQCVPEKVRDDPRAETFFGRLMLAGQVTEPQYDAGMKYRSAVKRYRSVCMPYLPPESPASIAGFMEPRSGTKTVDPADEQVIIDRYNAAFEALDQTGQRSARAVARVAVWDEWPEGILKRELDRGLDALVKHYHLTRRDASA